MLMDTRFWGGVTQIDNGDDYNFVNIPKTTELYKDRFYGNVNYMLTKLREKERQIKDLNVKATTIKCFRKPKRISL